MPDDFDWDTYDWCYECRGLGDDYRIDENNDLVSNCDDCVHNTWREEQDDA